MECHLELFLEGAWRTAARASPLGDSAALGSSGPTHLDYEIEYSLPRLDRTGLEAVSCRYPVSLELHRLERWPAFLLDLLPSGAPRRYWLGHLGLDDQPASHWPLLLAGAGNPPGNLRVREAAPPPPEGAHAGFEYEEVVATAPEFIEYAFRHGAPLAGSTAVQGDAPKLLLTQDTAGRWHADGALPDERASVHWILKLPRGRQEADRIILRHEAVYSRVARAAGLRVYAPSRHDRDILFVPRFDRAPARPRGGDVGGVPFPPRHMGGVVRHGLESLASLAGLTRFGERPPHETLCRAIARHCTEPRAEVAEYVLRDVLNLALGNTDNHPRNTAVLKLAGGRVLLAPIYDLAPMFMDPQMIPRACRWEGEQHGRPDWVEVVRQLADSELVEPDFGRRLAAFGRVVATLPGELAEAGADGDLILRLVPGIERLAADLRVLEQDR